MPFLYSLASGLHCGNLHSTDQTMQIDLMGMRNEGRKEMYVYFLKFWLTMERIRKILPGSIRFSFCHVIRFFCKCLGGIPGMRGRIRT